MLVSMRRMLFLNQHTCKETGIRYVPFQARGRVLTDGFLQYAHAVHVKAADAVLILIKHTASQIHGQ